MCNHEKICAHAYIITEGNPHVYSPEFASCDAISGTSEELRQIAQNITAAFVCCGEGGQRRGPETHDAIGVYEVGNAGIGHVHIGAFSKRLIELSFLQKTYPFALVDRVDRPIETAIDYLLKRGDFSDKRYMRKCKSVVWGNWIVR